MEPLIGFTLPQPEQAPVHDLQGVGFQVDQHEEQAIFRGRQGTDLIDGKAARRAKFAIQPPGGHPGVERRLEGRDQAVKLFTGQTAQIQQFRGAGVDVTEA
jgi:hypothetical protein